MKLIENEILEILQFDTKGRMADWENKANIQWANCGTFEWSQTIGDIKIRFRVPDGTRGKNIAYSLTPSTLKVGIKGSDSPVLDGKLSELVVPDESLWTLEDGWIEIGLQKQKKHTSWDSVLEGGAKLDPLTKEALDKKMMLEKFQGQHPGFDFSGADFSGQLPSDPAAFGDDWGNK